MSIYLVVINDFMHNYVEGTIAHGAYRTKESAKEAMRQCILEHCKDSTFYDDYDRTIEECIEDGDYSDYDFYINILETKLNN